MIIERTIKAPKATVWQALADPEKVRAWLSFFPDFKAEVGFETRFLLGRDPEHQYLHICRVTEVVEGRKLTHTWKYDGIPGNSLVSYELEENGDTTLLKLSHTVTEPFPADNPDFSSESFLEGWTWTADALKEFCEKAS